MMSDFAREIPPPDPLEDRVVGALRARALIRRPTSSRFRGAAIAAAAGILLFAAGFATGASQHRPATTPDTGGARFMLLLHETAATGSTGISEHELVDEYRKWAQTVSADGVSIRGEKLKDEAGETLSGFFIVEAPSLEAARAIAATCPHARYGGRIDVREIDPT
ncbi:MAG: YciI family protein [Vicinamibacterales bacterium]